MLHRLFISALVAVGAILAEVPPAGAATVAGERLPPVISLTTGPELRLVGCAPRQVLWAEVYALGLYLPGGIDVDRLRDPVTAKAAVVKIAYDGNMPDEPPDEWIKRLRQAATEESVQIFLGRYRTIQTGDTITVAHTPGHGTSVQFNGEIIIEEPGHGLVDALLGMWVGRDPVSESMRAELLAGDC